MTNQTNSVVLGGGCFWCIEAFLKEFKGIIDVTPGYSGGFTPNPTYEQVCTGSTGHAEVVKVTYDPAVLPLDALLDVFFAVHDPTTLNRQGHDEGTQYRSCIYFTSDAERASVDSALARAHTKWSDPIVSEVAPLVEFYEAEAYHKDYFANHPEQAYCQVIINPKLSDIKQRFASMMKG